MQVCMLFQLHVLPNIAQNIEIIEYKYDYSISRARKVPAPAGIDPRTIQSVGSHNTDYSIDRTLANTLCPRVSNKVQGGSNMTGTNCDLFTHKSVPVIFEPPCTKEFRILP
jgi:hypothetical protein